MIWTHRVRLEFSDEGEGRTLETFYPLIGELCQKYGWIRVPDHFITKLLHIAYSNCLLWPAHLPKWDWPMKKRDDVWKLIHERLPSGEVMSNELGVALRTLPMVGYQYTLAHHAYIDLRDVVRILPPKKKCFWCNRTLRRSYQEHQEKWLSRAYFRDRFSTRAYRDVMEYDRKVFCGPFCAKKYRNKILAVTAFLKKVESRQIMHERRIQQWQRVVI